MRHKLVSEEKRDMERKTCFDSKFFFVKISRGGYFLLGHTKLIFVIPQEVKEC